MMPLSKEMKLLRDIGLADFVRTREVIKDADAEARAMKGFRAATSLSPFLDLS